MKTVVVVVEGRDGGRRVYTLVRGETNVSGYVVMFQGQEYAKFFLLEYQREDSGHWHRYRDRNAEEVCTHPSVRPSVLCTSLSLHHHYRHYCANASVSYTV